MIINWLLFTIINHSGMICTNLAIKEPSPPTGEEGVYDSVQLVAITPISLWLIGGYIYTIHGLCNQLFTEGSLPCDVGLCSPITRKTTIVGLTCHYLWSSYWRETKFGTVGQFWGLQIGIWPKDNTTVCPLVCIRRNPFTSGNHDLPRINPLWSAMVWLQHLSTLFCGSQRPKIKRITMKSSSFTYSIVLVILDVSLETSIFSGLFQHRSGPLHSQATTETATIADR